MPLRGRVKPQPLARPHRSQIDFQWAHQKIDKKRPLSAMNIQTKRRQTGGKTVEKSLFYLNVHFLREKVILGKGVGWAFKLCVICNFLKRKCANLWHHLLRGLHTLLYPKEPLYNCKTGYSRDLLVKRIFWPFSLSAQKSTEEKNGWALNRR